MSQVIDFLSFSSSMGSVGVVISDTGRELEARVGNIMIPVTPALDAQRVAAAGAPFPLDAALAMSAAARIRQAGYQADPKAQPIDEVLK